VNVKDLRKFILIKGAEIIVAGQDQCRQHENLA
jgi:hypothetical protein